MSTFQDYTSLQESLELRRLGAGQAMGEGDYFYGNEVQEYALMLDRAYDFIPDGAIRAFTFQEMYFELLAHYGVGLDVLDGETELTLHPKEMRDYSLDGEPLALFANDGIDPFPAIYDAFVWHLKQRSSNPQA